MSTSKVISGDDLASLKRWNAPGVVIQNGTAIQHPEKAFSAKEIEELKQSAQQEGYEVGRQQGLRDGQADVALQAKKFAQLCETLAIPLAQLDDTVEQELVGLAFAIAKQIIRREIKTDPGHVVAVVREAIGQLPVATRTVRIYLHPDDAVTVRAVLSVSSNEQRCEIVDDLVLTRGGCRVVTESSQIDASVERRLAAAIAVLLGGERERDAIENAQSVPSQPR